MNLPKRINLLIKGVTVFDGEKFLRGRKDVLILGGKVIAMGEATQGAGSRLLLRVGKKDSPQGIATIDGRGLWLTPGFVDLHAHLREPGETEKETVETGLLSAGKGGFTLVVSMPNTKPPCDNIKVFKLQLWLREKATRRLGTGLPELRPSCALTKGRLGLEPANYEPLVRAGCAIFTDDGSDVENEMVLRDIFLSLRRFRGVRQMFHAEVQGLSGGGIVHLGPISEKLKVPGNTRLSEDVAVARAIVFAEAFKVPIHITHLSSYRSVELIRRAKSVFKKLGMEGLLTSDVTPHHLALTVDMVPRLGSLAKVNPPLREEKDRRALIQGLLDGTIDCIATDHAPHTEAEKRLPLKKAPFGIAGFETAFSVAMKACECWDNPARMRRVLSAMTKMPAQILGSNEQGRIAVGAPANLALVDPEALWTVRGAEFLSKCKVTPFEGMKLRGKVVLTIANGDCVWIDRKAVDPKLSLT